MDMTHLYKTGSGPAHPDYSGSKIDKKNDNQKKSVEQKISKPQEGTFQKLAEKSFDVKAFDSALRAQLKIDRPQKETAGTHLLPLKLSKTKLRDVVGPRIHPISGKRKFHNGIDLGGEKNLRVDATANGTIISINRNPKKSDFGIHLRIRHEDGTITTYAHLSKMNPKLVLGMKVKGGQKLGGVGKTGAVTGVHLHFEISRKATSADKDLPKNKRGEVVLDPLKYFPKDVVAKLSQDFSQMQARNEKDKSKSKPTIIAMGHGHNH